MLPSVPKYCKWYLPFIFFRSIRFMNLILLCFLHAFPYHCPWFRHTNINLLGKDIKLLSSTLCSFLHPFTSCYSDVNILLTVLFSNTHCLCSSFTMRVQVLYALYFQLWYWIKTNAQYTLKACSIFRGFCRWSNIWRRNIFLDFTHRLVVIKTTTYRKLVLLPSSGERRTKS
jgi:hypothetical protein